jgi:hypothetical protein
MCTDQISVVFDDAVESARSNFGRGVSEWLRLLFLLDPLQYQRELSAAGNSATAVF